MIMQYQILENYHRRGKKVWVTIKVSDFGTLTNKQGIEYDESYIWATLIYKDDKFNLLTDTVRSHDSYPIAEDLDLCSIERLVNESELEKKVLKIIKK